MPITTIPLAAQREREPVAASAAQREREPVAASAAQRERGPVADRRPVAGQEGGVSTEHGIHGFRVVAVGPVSSGFRAGLRALAARGFADPSCTIVKTARGPQSGVTHDGGRYVHPGNPYAASVVAEMRAQGIEPPPMPFVVAGLLWPRATAGAAFTSMLVGGSIAGLLSAAPSLAPPRLLPSIADLPGGELLGEPVIVAILVGAVVLVGVTLSTPKPFRVTPPAG